MKKYLNVFSTKPPKTSDALLNEHLTPLATFTLGSCESQQEKTALPCQVCERCAPGLFEHYGYDVADTAWCSQCHKKGECLDVPLIEHYRKYGIDDTFELKKRQQ